MPEAFIVDAVRSPVGRRGGSLAAVHPADLGAHSIAALMERTGVDPNEVDDVVFGNVDSVGPQAGCIARTCWLAAGLPQHVPGVTIDRQCGSAQQAVQFAAQAVMSGTMDLVVAGGVQNMSMVPIMSAADAGKALGFDDPFSGSPRWTTRYGTGEVSQFVGAEAMAEKWDISRDEMEEFAVELPRTRDPRPRRGSLRGRDRAARRARLRRGPARAELGEDPLAQDADRGRSVDGGRRQPDLRRFGGAADRQRGRGRSGTDSRRGHGSTTCRCSPTIRS